MVRFGLYKFAATGPSGFVSTSVDYVMDEMILTGCGVGSDYTYGITGLIST